MKMSNSANPERANPIGFCLSPSNVGSATGVHDEPSPNTAPHFRQDLASGVFKGAEQFGQNMSRLTWSSWRIWSVVVQGGLRIRIPQAGTRVRPSLALTLQALVPFGLGVVACRDASPRPVARFLRTLRVAMESCLGRVVTAILVHATAGCMGRSGHHGERKGRRKRHSREVRWDAGLHDDGSYTCDSCRLS